MANYNFNEDLIEGEDGEKIVIRDLKSVGGKFISDNKDNKFDIIMSMPTRGGQLVRETTYEIKTDVYCKPHEDTNNMFIEFECRGKESGICVTTSDWFVMHFKYLSELWYIKTDRLKSLIKNNNFTVTEFSGDAGSNTKGYLIPRYQFKKHFKVRLIPKEWQD